MSEPVFTQKSHTKRSSLLDQALALAARQRTENTRRAYAATYRSFCAFLETDGRPSTVEALTTKALRSYCESLQSHGRSQATVARHLSALRSLAQGLGVTQASQGEIKVERQPAQPPPMLTDDEYEALLGMPDIRTPRGKRDLAIIRLLGDCGLRRSELCALRWQDIAHTANCLQAQPLVRAEERTIYELVIQRDEPELGRRVPVTKGSLDALFDWHAACSASSEQYVFVPTRKGSAPLSDRMIANIVRAYAEKAELPEHCCSPHVLRHTFCARLAMRGATAQQIAELAGHVDTRTARLYVEGALAVA